MACGRDGINTVLSREILKPARIAATPLNSHPARLRSGFGDFSCLTPMRLPHLLLLHDEMHNVVGRPVGQELAERTIQDLNPDLAE